MGDRKPQPVLEVFFAGVYPEAIPVRSLADTLSAVYRLAIPLDDAEEAEPASPIRLLDVRRGSAAFRCVVDQPETLIEGLRTASSYLQDPRRSDRLEYALYPIRRLSEVAETLRCKIVLRDPAERNDVFATILPESYRFLADALLVKGDKTFVGKVESAGGATGTRCALRVSFQPRLLHCDVRGTDDRHTIELVRTLGRHLYEEIVVSGRAVWLKKSWRVIGFEITDVQQPAAGPLTDAIDALRAAGGDAWDKISDPESYLEELSGKS